MAASPWVPTTAAVVTSPKHDSVDAHWRAAAFFKLGRTWQAAEDYARAQTYYFHALRERPRHEPALHNISVVQIRLGRYGAAQYHLQSLSEQLADGSRSPVWPELRYSAAYNRALAQRYAGDLDDAVRTAMRLLEQMRSRLQELPPRPDATRVEEALRRSRD